MFEKYIFLRRKLSTKALGIIIFMAVLLASVFVATIETFLSLIFEVKAIFLLMVVER
jgi:hypothetical protein